MKEKNHNNKESKKIAFKVIKPVYWDDWGRLRKVFQEGNIYHGETHYKNGKLESVVAVSPYYLVSDYVDLNCIELL